MSIITVPMLVWPPVTTFGATPPTFTGTTLNAVNDKVGFIIQIPKDGTLDLFEWLTGTVSNQPDNGMRLSFQDVNPATGLPDGVIDQFRIMPQPLTANAWQIPGLITSDGTDTGTKRTVTRNQQIACVIDFASFVASDSLVVQRMSLGTALITNNISPYIADGSSGTYVKSTSGLPCMALKYSDGTYAIFNDAIPMLSTATGGAFVSPNEKALRFILPFSCRIAGFWAMVDHDNPVDFILYDSGTTVLLTLTPSTEIKISSGIEVAYYRFSSSLSLVKDTVYRLSMKPTTASGVSIQHWVANSNGLFAATPVGIEWYQSTRAGGAWTDVPNTRPFMGLVLDGIDSGSSGGAFAF